MQTIDVRHLMMSASRSAGGMYFAVQPLTQHMIDLGCDCRIIAPLDRYLKEDKNSWGRVQIDCYSTIGPRSLGYSRKINKLIGVPDIQHAHGIWMYFSHVNRLAAKNNNVPYVVSTHGMLDRWALENSYWKKKIVGWLYENRHLRDAACIHALCESESQSIREFGLKNPICVIPNAVDTHLQSNSFDSQQYKFASKRKTLLFLGRIHPKKGLVNLINAFANLNTKREGWVLVIAGWDQNHQHELESLACKRGISNAVEFPGPVFGEKKQQLLELSDAFILPSFSEGLPMSVLEAWSYSKASLITSACNLPEGKKYGAAIECEPDKDSLLHSLDELLSITDDARAEMGENARKLVEEKFSWPVVSKQMLEVYSWLLGRGSAPETVHFAE